MRRRAGARAVTTRDQSRDNCNPGGREIQEGGFVVINLLVDFSDSKMMDKREEGKDILNNRG